VVGQKHIVFPAVDLGPSGRIATWSEEGVMAGAEDRIAEIKPHPRRRHFYLLVLDDQQALCVHEDVIVALGLGAGRYLTADLREQIEYRSRLVDAEQIALRQLKTRARSRAELAGTLRGRGFEDAVIEEVLSKLENIRLVDDRELARDMTESLLRRRPMGRRGLHYRLTQRGLGDDVADAAVAQALEGSDELQHATDLLRRKLPGWEGLPAVKRRTRAYQLLARRGFEPDTIADALNTVLPDEP
jgi:regulatory protein